MRPVQRLILYLFPLYLTAMEQVIRTIFSSEAFSVSTTSSSISVGGLALLLPLLVPTPYTSGLTPEAVEALKASKVLVYKRRDQNIATSSWMFLVSMTFVWIFSLSKYAAEAKLEFYNYKIALPALIAFAIYLVGILHTEAKEFSR